MRTYDRPSALTRAIVREAMSAARLSPGNSITLKDRTEISWHPERQLSGPTFDRPPAKKSLALRAQEAENTRLRTSLIAAGRDLDSARTSARYWENLLRNLLGAIECRDEESMANCLSDAREAVYGEAQEVA